LLRFPRWWKNEQDLASKLNKTIITMLLEKNKFSKTFTSARRPSQAHSGPRPYFPSQGASAACFVGRTSDCCWPSSWKQPTAVLRCSSSAHQALTWAWAGIWLAHVGRIEPGHFQPLDAIRRPGAHFGGSKPASTGCLPTLITFQSICSPVSHTPGQRPVATPAGGGSACRRNKSSRLLLPFSHPLPFSITTTTRASSDGGCCPWRLKERCRVAAPLRAPSPVRALARG
jgi:hypothetical protein